MATASGGLSSGFDDPKVKAPLGALFSALEDAAPNATLPPAPNLNPGVGASAGGCSDFFSSLVALPNLKLPGGPANLNPEGGAASLEAFSDDWPSSRSFEEAPPPKPVATSDVPNLNPAGVESVELFGKPNLNPPDPESEPEPVVLSDVPNLNPPDPESEPKVAVGVPNLNPPDPEGKAEPVPDVPNLNPPEVALPELNAEEPGVPAAAQQNTERAGTRHFSLRKIGLLNTFLHFRWSPITGKSNIIFDNCTIINHSLDSLGCTLGRNADDATL